VKLERPRKVLLLASYCGDDDPTCTDDRPCVECLQMCNVFEVTELGQCVGQFDLQNAEPRSARGLFFNNGGVPR
jgi:hypothetical protein